MLLCIVHGILFVDTVNTCNVLNVLFVETIDTTLTQDYIQSTIKCENSTLLYPTLYKVASCPSKGEVYCTVPFILWV